MIHFYKAKDLTKTLDFYKSLGCSLFMTQPNCIVLDSGYGLFGFLQGDISNDKYSCLSFIVDSKPKVDAYYEKLKQVAISKPCLHANFPLYSCFFKDPNGYTVEVQTFIDDQYNRYCDTLNHHLDKNTL